MFKRQISETIAGGPIPIVKLTEGVNYEITLTTQDVSGTPPPETLVSSCDPQSHWEVLNPISGNFTPVAGPVLTHDFVYLRALYTDLDKLVAECVPNQVGCSSGTTTQVEAQDLVMYAWDCPQGTFPAGNTGRDVILKTPKVAMTMLVTLTVYNWPGRISDPNIVKTFQIPLQVVMREAQAATVGWIDGTHPNISTSPTATDTPPLPPPVPPGFYRASALTTLVQYKYDPTYGWHLEIPPAPPPPPPITYSHPWLAAKWAVEGSANPTPPSSFASIAALRTWMDDKQFRTTLAMHGKATARRNIIADVEVPTADIVMHEGWTPFPPYVVRLLMVPVTGTVPPPFSRAVFKDRTLYVKSICGADTRMELHQAFRLGALANSLNIKATNRDAPWIDATLIWHIKPGADPEVADLDIMNPQGFPSFRQYFSNGTGVLNSGGIHNVSVRLIDFINTGVRVDPLGL